MYIGLIERNAFDVSEAQEQLAAHPELWNEIPLRTEAEWSPHRESDDIWVRYNPKDQIMDSKGNASFDGIAGPHEPNWYACAEKIPAIKDICEKVRDKAGRKLMGVYVTRVPPGKQIYPHVDWGWHAENTDKFCVQIKGDQKQSFCFEGEELRANDGDLYWFFNQKSHWVLNESERERITLIIAIWR